MIARFCLCLVMFGLSLLLVPLTHAEQQPDIPPTTCPYTDSANYRADVAMTVRDGSLLLVDATSDATVRTLDTNFLSYYTWNIFWGTNCRYLFAINIWQPVEPYPRRFSAIYDTVTGRRVFQSGREPWGIETLWSPTQAQFLIKSATGLYLMNEDLADPVLLIDEFYYWNAMHYHEWDMAHGQLLVNFWMNPGYLMVYDLHTGATAAALPTPDVCAPTALRYTTSSDERFLIVYTIQGTPACVTVYNRDTWAVMAQVNAEEFTASDAAQIALSPDGHYLVIGLRALRVWDLWNLPEAFEERLPVYRHEGPLASIKSVTFVDNSTLETVSTDGVQRWNIVSGAQVE